MQNPFVYGEVVPASAFVDREVELERLTEDLLAGQKVFLISPRRYGKSSLVQKALAAVAKRGAVTISVTVSSYSSYVAFLEGYARALLTADARPDRVRAWLTQLLGPLRPELRLEPGSRLSVSFPTARTKSDVARLAEAVFARSETRAEARSRFQAELGPERPEQLRQPGPHAIRLCVGREERTGIALEKGHVRAIAADRDTDRHRAPLRHRAQRLLDERRLCLRRGEIRNTFWPATGPP